jgi:hypothetical protein
LEITSFDPPELDIIDFFELRYYDDDDEVDVDDEEVECLDDYYDGEFWGISVLTMRRQLV